MNTRDSGNEEKAGYGAGSLVGSDRAGLQSAIEAQQAVDEARRRAAGGGDEQVPDHDTGIGARDRADVGAGASPPAGSTSGTRASAGRSDVDRDPRDGGNSLQD
ncbi:hypothetical protein [Lysobacter xanthus]